ncbi:TraR/DksA C4-type zinc finger protein [Shewanella sp.]|nr:TraR/DksA C4-type zinc finger protein [Shewanella sp.]
MDTKQIKQTLYNIEIELRQKVCQLPDLQAHLLIQTHDSLSEIIKKMTDAQLCEHPLFFRLMQLDAAYCQLAMGLYGVCSDCEENIEAQLLRAEPLEQRCLACKQRNQQEHRQELRLNH